MRCKSKTKKDERCKNKAVSGSNYCHIHGSQNLTKQVDDKLNENQLRAIDLLVAGELTKTEIAKECNISRNTLYNWIDDEKFAKEYDKRLKEIRSKFNPKLTNLINETMRSITPQALEERDKIEGLEKLFKLYQLLNGEATEINKQELSGEVVSREEYDITKRIVSDDESRELAKQLFRRAVTSDMETDS